MQEPTFASLEFRHRKRQARRERFLERFEARVEAHRLLRGDEREA